MATAIEDVQKAYAICAGTFLEVTGLVGLVSRPIAGLIGVSATGSLLLLGVLGFAPGSAAGLRDVIGANGATSTLHVIIGGVSLAMGLGVRD